MKKEKILTADEIRRRRKGLGMNQRDFAEYLGVGIASLKRWEGGKTRNRSSDILIRLRTDLERGVDRTR